MKKEDKVFVALGVFTAALLVMIFGGAFWWFIGWLEATVLNVFYPHDYPAWAFGLGTALIFWFISLLKKTNKPLNLSASDGR